MNPLKDMGLDDRSFKIQILYPNSPPCCIFSKHSCVAKRPKRMV